MGIYYRIGKGREWDGVKSLLSSFIRCHLLFAGLSDDYCSFLGEGRDVV
jgi:hypothetical protein